MALLTSASIQQVQIILDLFPITTLREEWGLNKTKEEICLQVAGTRSRNEIADFVHKNFGICKQHIYVLKNEAGIESALKVLMPDLEEIKQTVTDFGVTKTFLSKHKVEVVILSEQTQRSSVEFVLPLQIVYSADYILLRFIIFERNFHVFYKGLEVIPIKKKDDREEAIVQQFVLQAIEANLQLYKADLHKGVKHLWESDWMDSCKIKYKDENSTLR